MEIKKLMLLAALCLPMMASAQWGRPATPNDTLISTEVLPDNKVAFRIYAPQAENVSISGDLMAFYFAKFEKNEVGIWETVVENVVPGAYRYNFVVDGVTVYDPKGPLASETKAILKVDDGQQFFSMRDDVPHGAVAQRYYYSSSLGTTRRMHVWTPAGYETSTEALPVLYLIHGGGDTDNSWPGVGQAGFILDNLLAEGKMVPMIVVMPNGTIATESLEGEVPLFAADMMNDIIPFVEKNYRVIADKDHRAMAGLSMGGLETLETGLPNYKDFGYLYVLSSGWFANDTETYAKKAVFLKEIAADFNDTVRLLAFTQGGPEDIAYNNCIAMLKLFDDAGIHYEFSEMPGGHSWHVWRHDLHNLAQRLFK